jgi:putative transposase
MSDEKPMGKVIQIDEARIRYIAGTAWSAKCYMNIRPLYQPQVPQTEAVA